MKERRGSVINSVIREFSFTWLQRQSFSALQSAPSVFLPTAQTGKETKQRYWSTAKNLSNSQIQTKEKRKASSTGSSVRC